MEDLTLEKTKRTLVVHLEKLEYQKNHIIALPTNKKKLETKLKEDCKVAKDFKAPTKTTQKVIEEPKITAGETISDLEIQLGVATQKSHDN